MSTPSAARFFRPGFLTSWFGVLAGVAQILGMAGEAAAAPTIVVEQPAGTIRTSNISTVSFTPSALGKAVQLIFTIKNTGTTDLTVSALTLDGTNKDDYTVTTPPGATVSPLATTTFVVTFNPSAIGLRKAMLHIESTDTTNTPFNIALEGIGTVPQIAVYQPAGTALTSGSSTPVDFSGSPVGTGVDKSFTIKNVGQADLTVGTVTIDGLNSADFKITPPASTTITAGNTVTFTVTFNPSASGPRTATLHIPSNDTTNTPFNVNLAGSGQTTVIAVEQPAGTVLVSGTSTVDFGSPTVGSVVTRTFTIRNTGAAILTGVAVTRDGTNSADFTVTASPATTVATSGNTVFTVSFKPAASGTRTATLHIAGSDATNTPFDIPLTGIGLAPLIAVEEPAGTSLTSDTSTVNCSSVVGTAVPLTFTIKNTGTSNLSVTGVTISGTNSTDFTVTTSPAAIVAAAGATTFTVTFNPPALGTRTAILHIASDDTPHSPFNINLSGFVAVSMLPSMEVDDPDGAKLTSETSTADCGSCMVGASKTVTFTIRNNGAADLTNLAATVTRRRANSTNYTVAAPQATTVIGGDSTTVVVTFKPLIKGVITSTLHITSNDLNYPTFDINLTGMGMTRPLPLLVVEDENSARLTANTSKVDFGPPLVVNVDPSNSQTFTIKNTGLAGLTGLAVTATKDKSASADFTVTPPAATVLAAGDSATFTVDFSPKANGVRTATLHIASNDATHHPFDIALTGTGLAPAIAVEAPTGTNQLAGTGKINFGNSLVSLPGTPHMMTVTIRNSGAKILNVSGVTVNGTNSADYAVSNPALSAVPANGGSTTFPVTFTPSANGLRTATLHVNSDDPTHPSFDIALTGTGVGGVGATPMIEVDQPVGTPLISGGTAKFQSDGSLKPISVPFTVLNILPVPGAKLKISKVSITGPNATEFKVTGSYGKTIVPGASTTIQVKFTPKTAGQKEAMLSIQSNAPGQSPYYVRLVGSSTTIVSIGKPGDGGNPKSAVAVPRVAMPPANAAIAAAGAVDMSAQIMQAAADAAPRFVVAKVAGHDWPALSFRRWKSPGSLTYRVEQSADMQNWSLVPTPWQVVGDIVDEGNGCERLTVPASESMSDGGQLYLRVRVQDGP